MSLTGSILLFIFSVIVGAIIGYVGYHIGYANGRDDAFDVCLKVAEERLNSLIEYNKDLDKRIKDIFYGNIGDDGK